MSTGRDVARRRARWCIQSSAVFLAVYVANVLLGLYAQRAHVSWPWLFGNLGEAILVFASIVLFVFAFMIIEGIDGNAS